MAANDNDCCCTLPLPLCDEALVRFYEQDESLDLQSSCTLTLSGFLALISLCKISGQVQSLQAPSEMKDLGTRTGKERIRKLALNQEKILEEWLRDLPEELRSIDKYAVFMLYWYITNHDDRIVNKKTSSELSVQALVIHAGTMITLYQ